jgi:fermentation-respiration switch protein FrsA (DUF1100 family)
VVHGDVDETVPYSDGRAIYDGASPPRYLLTILGGGHIIPYVAGPANPQTEPVRRAIVAFFDLYLKGRPDARDRLLAVDDLDIATVESDD